jgi:hypothetical protein
MRETKKCEIIQIVVSIVVIQMGDLSLFYAEVAVETKTDAASPSRKH